MGRTAAAGAAVGMGGGAGRVRSGAACLAGGAASREIAAGATVCGGVDGRGATGAGAAATGAGRETGAGAGASGRCGCFTGSSGAETGAAATTGCCGRAARRSCWIDGSALFCSLLTRQCLQFRLLHVPDDRDRPDTALDDDIGRAADHDEMFDIVTTHENQTTARIHGRCIKNLQARLPVATTTNKGRRAAAPAQKPQSNRQNEKRHTHTDNGDDEIVAIGADKIFHHGDHPFRFFGILISWTINIAVVLIV